MRSLVFSISWPLGGLLRAVILLLPLDLLVDFSITAEFFVSSSLRLLFLERVAATSSY